MQIKGRDFLPREEVKTEDMLWEGGERMGVQEVGGVFIISVSCSGCWLQDVLSQQQSMKQHTYDKQTVLYVYSTLIIS